MSHPVHALAIVALRRYASDRAASLAGKVSRPRGRPPANDSAQTSRYDAVLVRKLDFEMALSVLPDEQQALLLSRYTLGFEVAQSAAYAHVSPRAAAYKIPQAVAALAAVLEKRGII